MDELTLRDYLKVLFRQKWVIITAIITVTVVVALGLWIKTPVYEAQVKMLVSAQKGVESPYYAPLLNMQNVQVALTQSEIVKSNPVIERTLKAIGLKPLDFEKRFASPLRRKMIARQVALINKKLAEITTKTTDSKVAELQKQGILFRLALDDLKERVKVEPIRDTNLFTISYRDFDPGIAAAVANIISRSYVIFDLEQQLAEMQIKYGEKNLAVLQLKDNITKMEESLNGQTLPNIEAIGPASVKIVEQAIPPIKPAGLPKSTTFILAVFMSVFLGIMLAFMFEYIDQTFKSPQDIEKFLNLPFLGSIPRNKKLKKESLHTLSDQLHLLMKDKNLKSLLFTSALPREGTTTIVVNLAKHLSQKQGHKVLIIDANLRNPSMHKAFKISDSPGLADVLEEKVSLEQAIKKVDSSLNLLPAGKTELNPVTLLDSSMMSELIKMAKQKYELVFVDCANLRDFKDSAVISSHLDAACLVVNEGKTRRQVVKAALAPLEQKKVNLIGAILNNRTFAIPKAIYERV